MRKRLRTHRRSTRLLLIFMALVPAVLAACAGCVASLPSVDDAPERVSQILAAHDASESKPPLPGKLATALVAVEDEHFYSSVPLNVLDGMGRAALATLHTSSDPGGSTIAQQLAKELYGRHSGFLETLREIGLGVKLSLRYSKTRVLEMYLNATYFGHGYWGDLAAARGYFGRSPDRLDWAQATMLAGLPQAPSSYDPLLHYRLARQRQRHVLDQLVANDDLSKARANAIFRRPLSLRRSP